LKATEEEGKNRYGEQLEVSSTSPLRKKQTVPKIVQNLNRLELNARAKCCLTQWPGSTRTA
jgi:hypothetical protein